MTETHIYFIQCHLSYFLLIWGRHKGSCSASNSSCRITHTICSTGQFFFTRHVPLSKLTGYYRIIHKLSPIFWLTLLLRRIWWNLKNLLFELLISIWRRYILRLFYFSSIHRIYWASHIQGDLRYTCIIWASSFFPRAVGWSTRRGDGGHWRGRRRY